MTFSLKNIESNHAKQLFKDNENTSVENTHVESSPVGIDRISFTTPHYYVDLTDLAKARAIDPNKFTIGIGQSEQSVPPNNQDIVTLGAQAALPLLKYVKKDKLKMLIVGTESGVDASKSSALYIHNLLKLNSCARCIEIKEACYGGTAALMTACDYVRVHKDSQVLVIAADIARYGLNTPGEVTQGAGAVAMLISANPHVLKINDDSVVKSCDIQDFWRPVYQDTALARGKFSSEKYIEFFLDVWKKYSKQNSCDLNDFAALCFHLPYTKMGLKALRAAMDSSENLSETSRVRLLEKYETSTKYSRRIGNIYTGSLYLGLLSLLELDGNTEIANPEIVNPGAANPAATSIQTNEIQTSTIQTNSSCENQKFSSLKEGDKIGLFSYGSGAIGEFFTGTLMKGFKQALFASEHIEMLNSRVKLTVSEYEKMFNSVAKYCPEDFVSDSSHRERTKFFLNSISSQERNYI